MANVDICCVAGHEPDDVTMWWAGFWAVGEIYILSLADMVAKIKERLAEAEGSRIGVLRVAGHGGDWGQRFGADKVEALTIMDFKPCFEELAPLFGPGGMMILEGCGVGQAVVLLRYISTLVHAPVLAFDAAQFPAFPGYEGRMRVCYEGKTVLGPMMPNQQLKEGAKIGLKLLKYGLRTSL